MGTNHAEVTRRFFEALDSVDVETLFALMHPDIVWDVPGRSPIAGRHVGLDAVGAMMVRISEMSEGTSKTKVREIFVNDDGAVALVDVDQAPPGDEPWHGDDAWLIRTDGSQVTFVREHWFETRGFDELGAWKKFG